MPHKDPEAAKAWFRENYRKNKEKKLAYAKQYREQNPEKVSEAKKTCYQKSKQDPEFMKSRSQYGKRRRRNNRARVREIERASYEKNREKVIAYQRKHSHSPERKAREVVNRDIRQGRLPRASMMTCVVCRNPANQYHHHRGYAQESWLDVVPVCHQCHKDIHFKVLQLKDLIPS